MVARFNSCFRHYDFAETDRVIDETDLVHQAGQFECLQDVGVKSATDVGQKNDMVIVRGVIEEGRPKTG